MPTYPKIILKPGKEEALRRFHPWIFSGAIDHITSAVEEGEVAEIYDSKGNYLATGHTQRGSLAVKVLSFSQRTIDKDFWRDKLLSAYQLRESAGLINNPGTNAYRFVFGEGDGLPGLVIDHYNRTFILQAHSVGMHQLLPGITEVIREIFPEQVLSIYSKSADVLSRMFNYEVMDGFLFGNSFPEEIQENGVNYVFDYQGQKTGFFCDQRENRRLLGEIASGASVLDVCCFTGGFGLNALKSGASKVCFVDSSKNAILQVQKNALINGFGEGLRFEMDDARRFLESTEESFDIVILDPPAFAKHIGDRNKAIQGYRALNASAIRRVTPGGWLFTFSCSQVVDRAAFQSAVTAAAIDTGRDVRICRQLGHGPDHPVSIYHPEGEYLKGLLLKVQ